MSTVKATHFEHPSASTAGITLAADGSVVLPQGFAGGLGTNVVGVTKVDSFTTTSTSYVDVTDMTVTITPTSATSKILVMYHAMIGNSAADASFLVLNRDGTDIAVSSGGYTTWTGSRNSYASYENSIAHLDSPATTSAVVYKVRMKVASGTGTFNTVVGNPKGSVATLTAIEVAA